MADGRENLIPFNELSEEEHRELASRGGKASVEARRKKKAMKEQMETLLSMPIKSPQLKAQLKEQLGLEDEQMDNQMALIVAMWKEAVAGNTSAMNIIREITGEKVIEINVNSVTDEKVKEIERYLDEKATMA